MVRTSGGRWGRAIFHHLRLRHVHAGSSLSDWREFIVSRVIRIYPLYWVYTIVVVVVGLLAPAWRLGNFEPDVPTFARSFLITPGWGFPILGVGWTLEYEMVFYVFVAFLIALGCIRGRWMTTVAWGAGVLGCIGCVWGPESAGSALRFRVFSPYMLAFGAGWFFRCLEQAPPAAQLRSLALFGVIAAIAVWCGSDWGDRLVFRISVAAAVFGIFLGARCLFQADNMLNRIAWLVGDASYSLYLSHWFVLSSIGKFFGAFSPSPDVVWIVRIAGCLLSIAVGILLFRYLETPLNRRLRNYLPLRSQSGRANELTVQVRSSAPQAARYDVKEMAYCLLKVTLSVLRRDPCWLPV